MGAPLTEPPPPEVKSGWSTLQKILSGVAGLLGSVAAIIGALAAIGILGGGEEEDAEAPKSLMSVPVRFEAESRVSSTRFTELVARTVPPDTRIALSCEGGGCFDGTRERYLPEGSEAVHLTSLVPRRLAPGAVLEVRLTRPDHVGKLVRYQVGEREVPRSSTFCLPPGEAPVRC